MAGTELSPNSVCNEPLIYTGPGGDEGDAEVVTEERGDLMIRSLETRGKENIWILE